MFRQYFVIVAVFAYFSSAPVLAIDSSSDLRLASSIETNSALTAPYARKLSPFSIDGDLRGWEHLYALLVSKGISADQAAAILSDVRMPPNKALRFSVVALERADIYSRRNNRKERRNALKFYKENKHHFDAAEKQFQVPASIILALLQIETRCGVYTGRSRVFYRLARLASAADTESIEQSFEMNQLKNSTITKQQVIKRAEWLEEKFLPHLVAVLRIAEEKRIHPLEIRGSIAGALGLPQFLPGNYFDFGIDGNQDGEIDLFTAADAIHSVGNFLREHGWSSLGIPYQKQRSVIWEYNRSKPYVDTVFAMAKALSKHL
jgi:membrane-bound lytic murein transglycosylase B